MSGGSMDYLCDKVEHAAFAETTPLRRAFRKHLVLVAQALHDIEWVDSCDMSPGDEDAAIRAVLNSVTESTEAWDELTAAINTAETAWERLKIVRKDGKTL